MPFTFSHPAVILPFRYIGKKYFSITGLVVGSIVPDFEYFIRFQNRSHFSHTWAGIFWLDLPMGLLICFLFHNLVRNPLVLNLPYPFYARLARFSQFNWSRQFKEKWLTVICSIIFGVITHIISDRLTHKSSNLVSSVPGLIESQELIDSPKSIYRVIQITYSVIGLALCFFTIWRLPYNKRISYRRPDIRYWAILSCIFSMTLLVITFTQGKDKVDFIVGTISSMIVAFLITSMIPLPGKRMLLVRR